MDVDYIDIDCRIVNTNIYQSNENRGSEINK